MWEGTMRDGAGKSLKGTLTGFHRRGSTEGFCGVHWTTICALPEWPGTGKLALSLSARQQKKFSDRRTEPALQRRDDIPISVLLYIVQQKVIIVATSTGENYINFTIIRGQPDP